MQNLAQRLARGRHLMNGRSCYRPPNALPPVLQLRSLRARLPLLRLPAARQAPARGAVRPGSPGALHRHNARRVPARGRPGGCAQWLTMRLWEPGGESRFYPNHCEASLSKEWPLVCGLGLTRAACLYHPEPQKGASREEGKGDIQEPPQGANQLDLKKTS